MGLYDKLKQEGKNVLQKGTNTFNSITGNQQAMVMSDSQQLIGPPPVPQPVTPPPLPGQPLSTQSQCGIYSYYLENLIEMALADGELTEKEKQVLFKKAEAEGVDLDEFEMVLEGRLYKKKESMRVVLPTANPKSEKYGDVKKCPRCGAAVEPFSTRCPDCGHDFSNVGANVSINLLFQKLDEIEANRSAFKTFFYGGQNPEIKRKITVINTFPIPTTKSDILEFLSVCIPLAKRPQSNSLGVVPFEERMMADAWRAKCKQIIMKARLSMKDDKETLSEINKYEKMIW